MDIIQQRLASFPGSLKQLVAVSQTPAFQAVASTIGTGVILLSVVRLLSYGYTRLLRPSRLCKFRHSPNGSWALVTGASDGIGKAFAVELLRNQFNVLLHGRNKAKLEKLQRELNLRFPKRQVQLVVADASSFDHPERAVVEAVEKLPGNLTILINNVGGQSTDASFLSLADTSDKEVDELLNLNVRFSTQLTRSLLPTLAKNSPSLILSSGSIAGEVGMGYIPIYSASKAFTSNLTKALRMESYGESSGIEVTTAIIGNTISNSNTSDKPLITINAEKCAQACLAQVGHGDAFISPSWRHSFPLALMSALPEKVRSSATIGEMKKRAAVEQKGQ